MRRTVLLQALFLATLVGVFVLALLPVPPVMQMFSWQDKVEHVLAFATLMVLGGVAWPSARWRVIAGLLVYGAVIEAAQALTSWRVGDPLDWVADGLGVALGALILVTLRHRTRRNAAG